MYSNEHTLQDLLRKAYHRLDMDDTAQEMEVVRGRGLDQSADYEGTLYKGCFASGAGLGGIEAGIVLSALVADR